ncbi:NHL repeat-containing protein [Paraburkholderia megapolitana]|uniref:hypothetical protein n=1 Tax=Paraburkholderia megapolitana TaxID=420953 RepID=UPI0038B8EAC5
MSFRSHARRRFERLVFAAALLLPVLGLIVALDPGGATIQGAAYAEAGQATSSRNAASVASVASASAAAPSESAIQHPSLTYRTSWIGNTWGYAKQRWMQIDVQALAVAPDGDIYTNALWDEGGGEIGHYRDGQLLGYGGQSHGWGMLGGDAIALNDRYVFTAQVVESIGNALAAQKNLPPQGTRWYGVARRSRADFTQGVPFAGQMQWPGSTLAFRLIAQSSDHDDEAIRGLAADNQTLFVSNPSENRIEAFDAASMQPTGQFPVHEPGRLAIAPDGSLWIIERSRTDGARRVVHHARNGARLGTLTLPPGSVPVDLSFDANGRLLVADNGPRQQVLIFSPSRDAGAPVSAAPLTQHDNREVSMQLTATLGEAGGLYAGRRGAPGPLRFNGLTGVGADRAGNVYVAMNGIGPRGDGSDGNGGPQNGDGAVLESYTPEGALRFSLQGLLFVDGAQFVDEKASSLPSVYSGSKRFALDLSRPAGHEWSYAGYTADRSRYPYDPFFHLKQGQRGTPIVRDIDGRRLLYTLDMESSYLRIYRFEKTSETAIPAGFFAPDHIDGAWPPGQPSQGAWIWRDTAGKGRFVATDFDRPAVRDTSSDAPRVTTWWVDTRGDVWQGTLSQGIRRFPLQGFDNIGNPVYRYATMQRFTVPAPLTRITRVIYNAADDTMLLAGSTAARPFNEHNWNSASSTLARYDHWLAGSPVLRYTIDLPDSGPPHTEGINGIAEAGDYLFAAETMTGIVRVYDRDTGRDVGRLAPGPEVGAASGMIDDSMPMTAHRLASGEYLVLVEEDWHGKVLMYRFTPPVRALSTVSASLSSLPHSSPH